MKATRIIFAVILGVGLLWMLFAKSCGNDKDDDFSPPSNKNKTENAGNTTPANTTIEAETQMFDGYTTCDPVITFKFRIEVDGPVYEQFTGSTEKIYWDGKSDMALPNKIDQGPVHITSASNKPVHVKVYRVNR